MNIAQYRILFHRIIPETILLRSGVVTSKYVNFWDHEVKNITILRYIQHRFCFLPWQHS